MKLLKFNQFVNEGTEPTPPRRQYGSIDKLRSILIGKVVKMIGSSTKLNPMLKIEKVEAIDAANWSNTTIGPNKPGQVTGVKRDVVYLDCSIVNDYGEELGGISDSGIGGNVDVFYNCTNNPTKMFKIDSEIMGIANREIGGETYVNPNLAKEIDTYYGSLWKLTPTVKTDY